MRSEALTLPKQNKGRRDKSKSHKKPSSVSTHIRKSRYRRRKLAVDTWRIIPSNYPPIKIFEKCAEPEDLEALYYLEGLTNDRVQEEVGELARIAPKDRIAGPGSSVIMASFTHAGSPSRFTDGSFGVYYAALDLATAIAETRYGQALQMAHTNEPPFERIMRVYQARTNPERGAVDVRKDEAAHNPDSYAYSQALGRELREADEMGVYYRSVRNSKGECIAAFKPTLMKRARQGKYLRYCWDGEKIYHIDEVRQLRG